MMRNTHADLDDLDSSMDSITSKKKSVRQTLLERSKKGMEELFNSSTSSFHQKLRKSASSARLSGFNIFSASSKAKGGLDSGNATPCTEDLSKSEGSDDEFFFDTTPSKEQQQNEVEIKETKLDDSKQKGEEESIETPYQVEIESQLSENVTHGEMSLYPETPKAPRRATKGDFMELLCTPSLTRASSRDSAKAPTTIRRLDDSTVPQRKNLRRAKSLDLDSDWTANFKRSMVRLDDNDDDDDGSAKEHQQQQQMLMRASSTESGGPKKRRSSSSKIEGLSRAPSRGPRRTSSSNQLLPERSSSTTQPTLSRASSRETTRSHRRRRSSRRLEDDETSLSNTSSRRRDISRQRSNGKLMDAASEPSLSRASSGQVEKKSHARRRSKGRLEDLSSPEEASLSRAPSREPSKGRRRSTNRQLSTGKLELNSGESLPKGRSSFRQASHRSLEDCDLPKETRLSRASSGDSARTKPRRRSKGRLELECDTSKIEQIPVTEARPKRRSSSRQLLLDQPEGSASEELTKMARTTSSGASRKSSSRQQSTSKLEIVSSRDSEERPSTLADSIGDSKRTSRSRRSSKGRLEDFASADENGLLQKSQVDGKVRPRRRSKGTVELTPSLGGRRLTRSSSGDLDRISKNRRQSSRRQLEIISSEEDASLPNRCCSFQKDSSRRRRSSSCHSPRCRGESTGRRCCSVDRSDASASRTRRAGRDRKSVV